MPNTLSMGTKQDRTEYCGCMLVEIQKCLQKYNDNNVLRQMYYNKVINLKRK